MQLRTQSRLLPAAAVNEAVEARIEEYRERMGDLPGRREQRRLKAETRDKLLPQALLRSQRTKGLFLRSAGVLAIDAATPAKVERFLDYLTLALGRLEVAELPFRRPVSSLLTRVFLGDAPAGLRPGQECRMRDATDSKATVRFTDMDLADSNIRTHVRDGMVLTHLGIEFDNCMSCVLDDQGRLSKLRIAGTEADDTGAREDPLARHDAEMVLVAETLRRYLSALGGALGASD
jgi:recombination associated protein RdgC